MNTRSFIEFCVNQTIFIRITGPYALNGFYGCTDVTIDLVISGMSFCLYEDDIDSALRPFLGFLQGMLRGEDVLDSRIEGDLGMLWNDILQKRIEEFPLTQRSWGTIWRGLDYALWDNVLTKLDTWMYLKDGIAHLDVTSCYRWHFNSPMPGEVYISYDEFRKQYTPVAQLVISMATIKKWERKAAKLLAIIEKNQNKLNKKYKVGQYGPHGSGM